MYIWISHFRFWEGRGSQDKSRFSQAILIIKVYILKLQILTHYIEL